MEKAFHASKPGDFPRAGEEIVRQLIYVSTTARRHDEREMSDLLAQSRRDNRRHGITGLLLYKDGHFMQVLEGPPDAIRNVFERIGRDRRHRDLITILDRIGGGRDFQDWSMGYRRLEPDEIPGEGFDDFLLMAAAPEEDSSLALHLLKRFADGIRG